MALKQINIKARNPKIAKTKFLSKNPHLKVYDVTRLHPLGVPPSDRAYRVTGVSKR